jgi:hypothetical protein
MRVRREMIERIERRVRREREREKNKNKTNILIDKQFKGKRTKTCWL